MDYSNDLMNPARLEGESFEDYKHRQKIIKNVQKIYKRYGPDGAQRIANYFEQLNKEDDRPKFHNKLGPSTGNS